MKTPARRRAGLLLGSLLSAAYGPGRRTPAHPRVQPRQRPEGHRPRGPPRAGGGFPALVQGRLQLRDTRPHRPVPRPRTHDVQGQPQARPRRSLAGAARPRCGRERLHHRRLHRLLPGAGPRPPAGGAGAGSRPHGPPGPAGRPVQERDRGDQGGAPPAHRRQSQRPRLRALQGRRLPGQRLPHPDHRLDGRPAAHDHRRPAPLVRILVRAEQRHPGGGRRRHRRRGQSARAAVLRRDPETRPARRRASRWSWPSPASAA